MKSAPYIEALALLEIDGLPRAISAHDAALKKAPVEVLACAPVSPGKVILLFHGDVASVEESLAAAELIAGSRRLDALFLPGVHSGVVAALSGAHTPRQGAALAILELSTAAATLRAADAALKCSAVALGRLHLATGFGGKGYFTLVGELADIEAAAATSHEVAGDKLLDCEVLPAPHAELDAAALRRPWALDPGMPE